MGAPVSVIGSVSRDYTKIPNALLYHQDLSANEKLVVMTMLSYREGYEVTLQGIADDSGLSINTTRRCVTRLEELGFIERQWETVGGKRVPKAYKVILIKLSDDAKLEPTKLEPTKMGPSTLPNWDPTASQNGTYQNGSLPNWDPTASQNGTLQPPKLGDVNKTTKTNKIIYRGVDEKNNLNYSNPKIDSPAATPQGDKAGSDGEFETFYSEFPANRRGPRDTARELWDTAVTSGVDPQQIVDGARTYRNSLNKPKYHYGMRRFFEDQAYATATDEAADLVASDKRLREHLRVLMGEN